MKKLKIIQGNFEASVQDDADKVNISFVIPRQQDDFNADDFTYILDHIMELAANKDGKYTVQFQGVDAQIVP